MKIFLISQICFSEMKNSSCIFFSSKFIYFGQRSPLKSNIFRFLSTRAKIDEIPHLNFEMASQFLFKFTSFFIVMIHNSSVKFKFTYFLLWTKDSIRVSILKISSALVKICQIAHTIFQTTSLFFFEDNSSVLF